MLNTDQSALVKEAIQRTQAAVLEIEATVATLTMTCLSLARTKDPQSCEEQIHTLRGYLDGLGYGEALKPVIDRLDAFQA